LMLELNPINTPIPLSDGMLNLLIYQEFELS